MTTIVDLVFLVGIFLGPLLVVGTCVMLRMTRQPQWVFATAIALSAVTALAWVTYWYLWGEIFEYADAYRPVPLALDRSSYIAIAVCFISTVMVAALGVSRVVLAWSNRHNSGLAPST